MHKQGNRILEEFRNIYYELESLHIIPEWKWCERALKKVSGLLKKYQLRYFVDSTGNVVLNCENGEELKRKISEGHIYRIYQSHLDHPGGILLDKVDHKHNLYAASFGGGGLSSMEGRHLHIYDFSRDVHDDVKVERDIVSSAGRFIYFISDKELTPQHSYIRFGLPRGAKQSNESSLFDATALDDLVGCAAVIQALSKNKETYNIGLLTLGEEIGGYGIKRFLDEFMVPGSYGPHFINIDTPEEEKDRFECGAGIKLRVEDKREKYSSELAISISKEFPELPKISLVKGATEASFIVRRGYKGVGLAIPIRNIHNGSRHNQWVCESANNDDIVDLCIKLSKMMAIKPKFPRTKSMSLKRRLYKISYINHAKELSEKIMETGEYCEFLTRVAPHWNKLNSGHDVKPVYFSQQMYETLKNEISSLDKALVKLDIKKRASLISEQVVNLVGNGRAISKELQITSFLKAGFNACNRSGNIALSLERIKLHDLDRILAHEITHWICDQLYQPTTFSNYVNSLLSEGTACFVSGVIAGVGPQAALGLTEKIINHYEGIEPDLKRNFMNIITGKSVRLVKTPQHTTLKKMSYEEPFIISDDNAHNKYGYFLGLKFVNVLINEHSYKISDIWTNAGKTEHLLREFLCT